MAELNIIAHLDAMEGRLTTAIAEVRKDTKLTAELTAKHDVRLEHLETQQKWIWSAFGGATLTALGAAVGHFLGWVGVGVHKGH